IRTPQRGVSLRGGCPVETVVSKCPERAPVASGEGIRSMSREALWALRSAISPCRGSGLRRYALRGALARSFRACESPTNSLITRPVCRRPCALFVAQAEVNGKEFHGR